ncbi:MAG: tRNA (guanosine(37)-N1)-methyltransferase TrmD [Armatimonadetes bacterium]|nr:tRNA (guanosine(37)-N1)-methyltransferase TrmD [Armatimonadota bacterium]
MQVRFVTLFPDAVLAAVRHSILKRAEDAGIARFDAINPRDFATGNHKAVDDEPYGGGAGMLLKPDIVAAAIESAGPEGACVVFTDPTGELFSEKAAAYLAEQERIIFVCGHYEGVDERVTQKYATNRYSIGDYILTGGELPAAVMADAVVRRLPGVLGSAQSLDQDAFGDGLLTYPQYTRPAEWEGLSVPEILLSGNHREIAAWRRKERLTLTRKTRPDLFARAPLSKDDLKLLQ